MHLQIDSINLENLNYQGEYDKAFNDYDIEALEHVFMFWRQSTPKISLIVEDLIAGYAFPRAIRKAIAATSILAEQPNKNPFHNNHHFLEVFALGFFLGKYAHENKIVSLDNFGLLLIASLIHDYKHDGQGNVQEDGHKPYRLERNSYDQAEEVLQAAGLNEEQLKLILQTVLATDTSATEGQSPASTLRRYSAQPDMLTLGGDLDVFADPEKREIGLMMLDADVGQSAAMSYEGNNERGKLVAQEIGIDHSDDFMKEFLTRICEKQFFSKAGKKLLQHRMDKILEKYGI